MLGIYARTLPSPTGHPTLVGALVWALALGACAAPSSVRPDATLDGATDAPQDALSEPPFTFDASGLAPLPPVPVGLEALRRWDLLPRIRLGVRAVMLSTFDRAGGNEGSDASHFVRFDSPTRAVVADLEGPGELYFWRTNHWHGSPWHHGLDSADFVVTESSTADPDHPVTGSVFEPRTLLPAPLTYTWSATRGADLDWVPMGFASRFVMAYERTHYGTGYGVVHRFARGADHLTPSLHPWDSVTAPDPDVLALLTHAGEDQAPRGAGVAVTALDLAPSATGTTLLAQLAGPGVLRALTLTAPRASALALGRARLRITWDGRATPSVDAPLALLHGAGTLYNRDNSEWLVRGLLHSVRFAADTVTLALYFPMPFAQSARLELVGAGEALPTVHAELRAVQPVDPPAWSAYFHATYVDHGAPTRGRDLVLLDTAQAEGGGPWCGHFAGTSFVFSDRAVLSTLEGDPRFYFDDSLTPQGQGTGTEEWGGGGDYWGGQTMTLPFAGHPTGAPDAASARDPEDLIESAYRVLVSDLMPFGRSARIQLEHGGANDVPEHYRTVTYWYGRPGACLVPTDTLHVSDDADERAHGYTATQGSGVDTLRSLFDGGPDAIDGVTLVEPTQDTGRHHTGTSEFTVQLDPANVGLLLRRRFDQSYADPRAEVWIAPAAGGAFVSAGVWYTAGSNASVYSNPGAETGAAEMTVEHSNRRFREDEFLVPRALTAGLASVRVRFVHAPRTSALIPGGPQPDTAWSEFRYTALCYVLPQ